MNLLLLILAVLAGCGGELTSIPDTTTRVGKPKVEPGTELELRIFTTESECRSRVQPDEIGLCMPYVDRSNGEVRLGFQFRLDSDVFPLPLSDEHIKIGHLGRELQGGERTRSRSFPMTRFVRLSCSSCSLTARRR